jgi:hypothetical protein
MAKKAQETSPLDFSNSVYSWLQDSQEQITELQGKAEDPGLAVNAHALQHLTQIGRAVDQAKEDLDFLLSSAQAEEPAPVKQKTE